MDYDNTSNSPIQTPSVLLKIDELIHIFTDNESNMDNDNSMSAATSIDLSVFEKESSCKHNDDPKLCEVVQLLLTGLRYYSVLDIKNNQIHKDIFTTRSHYGLFSFKNMSWTSNT